MTNMDIPVRIMLSVTTNDPEKLQKTVEHFSRVITGLAMDGVKTWLNVEQDPDEENNDG